MKISNAKVCVDCEEILPEDCQSCPSCTGRILFPLANWLLETKVQERQNTVLKEMQIEQESHSV